MSVVGLTEIQPKIRPGKDRVLEKGSYAKVVSGAFGTVEECYGLVEEIIEPRNGGIFTKFEGCSYLYRGYPDDKVLLSLRAPKVAFRLFRRLLSIKTIKVILVTTFFIRKKLAKNILLKFINIFLQESYYMIEPHLLEHRKYCASVKDIHRAMTAMIEEIESQKTRKIACQIRNTICMFLEYDSAYKFRMQDIITEINKRKLKDNPIEEIKRAFEIFIKRDSIPSVVKKCKEIEKLLIFFLKIDKRIKKLLVRFILDLDFERVKLCEADWYFCLRRNDYNYRGVSFEDRLKEAERIDKEKNHYRPKLKVLVSE